MKKFIIVGSGAGGATVARELAKKGKNVTIIEKGPYTKIKDAFKHYENVEVGVELLKTSCVGGTTLVTAGNAVRTCQEQLKNIGIDLEITSKKLKLKWVYQHFQIHILDRALNL